MDDSRSVVPEVTVGGNNEKGCSRCSAVSAYASGGGIAAAAAAAAALRSSSDGEASRDEDGVTVLLRLREASAGMGKENS